MRKKGFAFMAEAAFAFILLLAAASFLPLFSHVPQNRQLLLACNDAAIVLSKSGAFNDHSALEGRLQELSSLSGACIEARHDGLAFGSCGKQGEVAAVSFPVWSGNLSSATLLCSQG
jgi:hypothetical protein